MRLVDLAQFIPDAVIDMRYASANNIAGQALQQSLTVAKLDEHVARRLALVAEQLTAQGLRLVIWDAYRPKSVHVQLQELQPDARYVAKNSNHCKGLAVDVTLANTEGRYLDMGTDHDEFSQRAHINTGGLSAMQVANRRILTVSMESAGFVRWPYEWWHFDYVG